MFLYPSHPPSGLPDTIRHHVLTEGAGDLDSSTPSTCSPRIVDIAHRMKRLSERVNDAYNLSCCDSTLPVLPRVRDVRAACHLGQLLCRNRCTRIGPSILRLRKRSQQSACHSNALSQHP